MFADWNPLDRFGVVVHEPFGVVGASYMLQLAITAFYDSRPARRSRDMPTYPDVFVFHVGGRFGDHANFDVYPPRKEVFVENAPAAILNAINDRGITRLAVPERGIDRVQHDWKEPAPALDRIVSAWIYSAGGRVAHADVTISASAPAAEANTKMSLHADQSYHERQAARAAIGDIAIPDDESLVLPDGREDEVSREIRDRIRDGRALLRDERGWTETYRRISVLDSLGMLHRGSAPDFVVQRASEMLDTPRRFGECAKSS